MDAKNSDSCDVGPRFSSIDKKLQTSFPIYVLTKGSILCYKFDLSFVQTSLTGLSC